MRQSSTPATILVRFQEAGFHAWEQAPEHRSYLRQQHRHLFHVQVETSVTNDDREIEFHDLREFAVRSFRALGRDPNNANNLLFGGFSCETIARVIARDLARHYERPFTVSVLEDGECGALVTEDQHAWV